MIRAEHTPSRGRVVTAARPEQKCPCHGKTEAELAMPYALIAFSLPVLALVGLLIAWLLS